MSYIQRHALTLITTFCILLFSIIGFAVMDDFGITWDEDAELKVAQNQLEYIQTGDEDLLLFGQNVALRHYGAAFPVLLQTTSIATQKIFGLPKVDAQHVLIFLSGITMVIATVLIARRFFNEWIGLLSGLLLMLHPHVFAHSFYNSKDLPIAACITVTLYLLYRAITQQSYKWAVSAGLVYGFGLATLVTTVMGLPIFVGSYILYRLFGSKKQWKQYSKKDAVLILVFLISSLLTTFIFWPTLWTQPLFLINSITFFLEHSWKGDVLYFGEIYKSFNLPWHYAPVFVFLNTPLLTFLTMLVGVATSFKAIKKDNKRFEWATLLLWFAFPILLFMKPGAVNYDGVRHFLTAFPAMAIIAAAGLYYFFTFLEKRFKWKYIKPIGTGIIVLWLLIEMIRIHPFQGSYFNEVVRLSTSHIENTFEFEYWSASYRQGIEWINEHARNDAIICAPLANHLLRSYTIREDLKIDCAGEATYILLLTRGGKQKFEPRIPNPETYRHVHTISKMSSDLVYIYEME